MPFFAYKARNASGEMLQGVMEGADSGAVADQLFATGVTPVDIVQTKKAVTASSDIGLWQRLTEKKVALDGRAAVQPPDVHPAESRRAHHARPGRLAGVGRQPGLRARHQGRARIARRRARTVGRHGAPPGRVYAVLPVDGARGRNDGPPRRSLPAPVRPPGIRPRHARPRQVGHALPDLCDCRHDPGDGDRQRVRDSPVRQGVRRFQGRTAADDAHADRHVRVL